MTLQLTRKWFRPAVVVLVVVIGLLALGIMIYAAHIRTSATALIKSAREIRSTADAQREIAAWRSRSGTQFWEESDHLGGDHNYDAHVDNIFLSRLRIVEPTNVTLGVTMNDGKLRSVTLVMFTGRLPSTTSGVWIQEWFDSRAVGDLRVNAKDRPWKATVEFSSVVPEPQREEAFALNTKCFVRPGGCKSAEDVLPAVWKLGAPLSGYLPQRFSALMPKHGG